MLLWAATTMFQQQLSAQQLPSATTSDPIYHAQLPMAQTFHHHAAAAKPTAELVIENASLKQRAKVRGCGQQRDCR